MAWSDYDYLEEGLEEVRKAVREQARLVERENGYDPDNPDVKAISDLEERLFSVPDCGGQARIEAARTLARDIAALPITAWHHAGSLLASLRLEAAITDEERNNDPDRPFRP